MGSVPAISVLLPVKNARPWLERALDSLWRQTCCDFEVVAVDDGSADGSGALLERIAIREPRLRPVHTPGQGLPATLNHALRHARGRFVARMDADDLAARTRLALQREHLEAHPGLAVVGSRVRLFPPAAVGAGMQRWVTWHNALLEHEAMAREMLIDSPLAHGTAMIRREWLDRVGGWTSQPWAEDLDLWIRMLDAGARLAKRPETLYAWRQHADSATRRDPRYRLEQFRELKLDTLARWMLRDGTAPTVVGVGTSLARWHAALRARWPGTRAIEARMPDSAVLRSCRLPIVLVLVAYQRRDLWRRAMEGGGLVECRDFVFVA